MKTCTLVLLLTGLTPAYAQLGFVDSSAATGSSGAVVVDEAPLTHTGQIFPFNKKGDLVGKGDISLQLKQVFKNTEVVLNETGSAITNVVKINVHTSSSSFIPEIQKHFAKVFSGKTKPAVTYITYKLWNGADVGIDVIAVSGNNEKKVQYHQPGSLYKTNLHVQAAILPKGGVTYISGQADKGDLLTGTRGTLKQLDASLKQMGMDKTDVVQLKAYMSTISDIAIVEKEMAEYFKDTTVPPIIYAEWVSHEYPIEIELIAASPAADAKRDSAITYVHFPWMVHSPVYSKATQVNYGKKIYISGLYGVTPNDANAQTQELFLMLKQLLNATGSDFTHLVKATYFHTDAAASTALYNTRLKYYDHNRAPGATKAMLKEMPAGKSISFDMIGVVR